MRDEDGFTWHTYRSAAKRAGRGVSTIANWRRWGMPMEWRIIEGQRARVVREDILLAHIRQHLAAWPAHQYRMRALRGQGLVRSLARPGFGPPTPE